MNFIEAVNAASQGRKIVFKQDSEGFYLKLNTNLSISIVFYTDESEIPTRWPICLKHVNGEWGEA